MVTLAVDTSGLTASCAVVQDGKVIAELSTKHGKTTHKNTSHDKTTLQWNKEMKEVDLSPQLALVLYRIKNWCGYNRFGIFLKRPVCGVPTSGCSGLFHARF